MRVAFDERKETHPTALYKEGKRFKYLRLGVNLKLWEI